MRKRTVAVFLFLCLFMVYVQPFAFAEALPGHQYADRIWEPYVEKDASLSTGQVTLWSCVTFGSYPQTEIISAAFTAVDDYAVQEGDILTDPVLYEKLVSAEWNDNRTEIGGNRYLRMGREEAVTSAADSVQTPLGTSSVDITAPPSPTSISTALSTDRADESGRNSPPFL